MITEHERVVLNADIPENGLESGDVGTVVHMHDGGRAYEVEFVSLDGATSIVVTVSAAGLRPVYEREIPHARKLAYA